MKNRIILSFLVVISLAIMLVACGGGDDGGILPPIASKTLGDVQALYANNGADWNDYVQGGDITNATDTACDPAIDSACVHGAEVRMVVLAELSSCAGIAASDSAGAFEWICDDASGTATLISNGLSAGYGLGNLIDFDLPAWKEMSVTVTVNGGEYGISNSTVWWDNPVETNSTGGIFAVPGKVYVLREHSDGLLYDLRADRIAIVAAPGVIMNGPGAGVGSYALYASGLDFQWLEGMAINASGSDTGIYWSSVRFSRIHNVRAEYASAGDRSGILLLSSTHNLLTDLVLENNANHGLVFLASTENNVSSVRANNNDSGVHLTGGSNSNTLTDMEADGNTRYGLWVVTSNLNLFSGVRVDDNSTDGVNMINSHNNTVREVRADGNNASGVVLSGANTNIFSEIDTNGNAAYGFQLSSSTSNKVEGIRASNNLLNGINILSSGANEFLGVRAHHNGNAGLYMDSSGGNLVSGVTAGNNVVYGMHIKSSADSIFSDITASGNDTSVYLELSSSNLLLGVTAANNANQGVQLISSPNNTLAGLTLVNNGDNGLRFISATGNVVIDASSANNGNTGVLLSNASNNQFTGLLQAGSNAALNCSVGGGTNPGLVHDTCTETGVTGSDTYGIANTSDALFTNSISLASSLVGKVDLTDAVNASNVNGTASYPADPASFDWSSFENAYRTWGKDGLDFPSADNRHRWTVDTGRIWDWSLLGADLVVRGALNMPTGDSTIVHTWNDASTVEFLSHAVEVLDDGIGNNNLLCEADEACLYTPNMGSYQGHGYIISVGSIGIGGILENITLMKYETNGHIY